MALAARKGRAKSAVRKKGRAVVKKTTTRAKAALKPAVKRVARKKLVKRIIAKRKPAAKRKTAKRTMRKTANRTRAMSRLTTTGQFVDVSGVARPVASGTKRSLDVEDLFARIEAAFKRAAKEAVCEAHAAGLAVPGNRDGQDIEFRPDKTVRPIKGKNWSPRAARAN